MTRICGSINAMGMGDLSEHLQAGDTAIHFDDAVSRRSVQTPVHAVSCYTSTTRLAGNSAIVHGRLRWEDTTLAKLGRERGNAHALLVAYEKHGTKFLSLLRGEFALVIQDADRRRALVAIDRMGIQPLCYCRTASGRIVFGSTTDMVRRHPDVAAEIDPQSLFDYIYFHFVPSPGTIYREIHKLEPAQYVIFEGGKLESGYYWRPDFRENASRADLAVLKRDLKDNLRASVMHCEPDKHTGAFLSGGLDSSTVCGLLAETSEQRIPAYTIGFEATGYDEIEYARIAARHFKLDLHEYYVTPEDIVEAIPLIARAYDEPFGNSSAIPALFCARLAREHGSRILLAGDGGDELFGGNTRYVKQQVFDLYSLLPGWLRGRLLEPLIMRPNGVQQLPLLRKALSYIDQARLPMPERMESYNYLRRTPLDAIFDSDFLGSIDTGHPLALLDQTYRDAPAQSLLNRMLYLDWKITLADNDLRKVMRTCETAGVEVRFPMVDETLVDFSTRVPTRLKINRFRLRHFYKQALDDFLPAAIINKSKHGFGLPFGEWLKTSVKLQGLVHSSLSALKQRSIFRPTFIDTLAATHRTEHAAYYGTMIWVLVMLEQWFQEHRSVSTMTHVSTPDTSLRVD